MLGILKKGENPILECKQTTNHPASHRRRDDCDLWGQYFFCWFLMVCGLNGCENIENNVLYLFSFLYSFVVECHVKDNKIAKKGRHFITFYYSCSMGKINSLNILEAFLNHRIRMVCAASTNNGTVKATDIYIDFCWCWKLLLFVGDFCLIALLFDLILSSIPNYVVTAVMLLSIWSWYSVRILRWPIRCGFF